MALRTSFFFLLAFATANLFSAFSADFNKETCGGMCMKVLRKSGKVLFRRCRNNKNFADAFTIELDDAKQLRANGSEIGGRRFAFKTRDFIHGSLNTSATLQNLKAVKLSVKAHLEGHMSYLHVDLYILCQNGTIKFGDDEMELRSGSLKFYLRLENYTSSETKDIELGLIVKGRKNRGPRKDEDIKESDIRQKLMPCRKVGKCGKRFRFGSGAKDDDEMSAASKCKINGRLANFSKSDYPKLMSNGGKHRIVFRVPGNGTKSIEIDPGVTLGDETDNNGSDDSDAVTAAQLNLMLFFVMLASVFAFK